MELNMTEAEALKILNGESENSNNISDLQTALKIAAKALEEVLTFKRVGTAERFRELSEKSKNGLLVELPCKPGDTVYLTNHDRLIWKEKPFICTIEKFTISDSECYAILNANEPFYSMHEFRTVNIKEFGQTIFLTEEEAVQAIKRTKEKIEMIDEYKER